MMADNKSRAGSSKMKMADRCPSGSKRNGSERGESTRPEEQGKEATSFTTADCHGDHRLLVN